MKQHNGEWTDPETAAFSGIPDHSDCYAFFSHDGRTLFFTSRRPLSDDEESKEESDIYISFKGKENEWLEPVNMGDKINSSFHEVAPYVSPDGQYLFFCSFRPNFPPCGENRLTFKEIQKLLDGPGNGRGDIYWVSAKIIEDLRPKE
jgi:hypothetical protein